MKPARANKKEAVVTISMNRVLLPALNYEDEIYVAPLNGQHLDALPKHLADDFHQKAMSGDDISKFNFGFVTDKGDFLNREDALKYAIEVGLLHPSNAQYVALTSGLLPVCSTRKP
ncbi:hypothetical protein ACO2JO_18450 [Leptospira interrogans]